MTRYEYGFLQACRQRGVDGRPILQKIASQMKLAADPPAPPAPQAAPSGPNWAQRQWAAGKEALGKGWDSTKAFAKENPGGIGAIGGGAAGAMAMLIYEAARKKREGEKRKDYLKALLLGLNGGAALGYAGGHWGPGLYEKSKGGIDAIGNWAGNVGRAIAGGKTTPKPKKTNP